MGKKNKGEYCCIVNRDRNDQCFLLMWITVALDCILHIYSQIFL